MKLILLSGGSGKRLWPISNDSRSKQFIKVLFNEEKNEYESMVQRVWRQITEADLHTDTIIISNRQQKDVLESQIPEAKKIYEPTRKDTFPAIALACLYLKDVEKISLNEDIIISPVDPYVTSEYFTEMKKLPNITTKDSNLSLMGVTPKEPSEKYGYIIKDENDHESLFTVKKFVEKPDKNLAKTLIEDGALWNCGVFCFKLKYIIRELEKRNLPISYDEFLKSYEQLNKNSFDYEIVEKTNNILVMKFDGLWKDLGTWSSLSEEMNSTTLGDSFLDSTCTNTTVVNELSIPIIGMELHNLIVAAGPDGILISEKNMSDNLKKSLDQTSLSNIIMYEERLWGSYKVLDYARSEEGYETITKRLFIHKGKSISYQYHSKREEMWTVISGVATVVIEDKVFKLQNGESIRIEKGERHYIKALTDLELIEIQSGNIDKNDVIRFNTPTYQSI